MSDTISKVQWWPHWSNLELLIVTQWACNCLLIHELCHRRLLSSHSILLRMMSPQGVEPQRGRVEQQHYGSEQRLSICMRDVMKCVQWSISRFTCISMNLLCHTVRWNKCFSYLISSICCGCVHMWWECVVLSHILVADLAVIMTESCWTSLIQWPASLSQVALQIAAVSLSIGYQGCVPFRTESRRPLSFTFKCWTGHRIAIQIWI